MAEFRAVVRTATVDQMEVYILLDKALLKGYGILSLLLVVWSFHDKNLIVGQRKLNLDYPFDHLFGKYSNFVDNVKKITNDRTFLRI